MVDLDSSLISAIIGAFIGIFGTILVYYLGKKRMKVAYEKISVSTMMNIDSKIRDKIKVEYENKPINNIYSFNVKIKNTGNTVIEKLPILFEFDSNTKILGNNIKTIPEREFIIEKKDVDKESEIKYEIDFLNPNDLIFFSFLTANNESEYLKLYARAKGLNFYESRIVSKDELIKEILSNIYFLDVYPIISPFRFRRVK